MILSRLFFAILIWDDSFSSWNKSLRHFLTILALSTMMIASRRAPSITSTAILILVLFLIQDHDNLAQSFSPNRRLIRQTDLHAVTKRQDAIFDGAEFVSLASFVLGENSSRGKGRDRLLEDNLPKMRAGFLTIITGTSEESDGSSRVVGIESPSSDESADDVISLGDGTMVYKDSVATIPEGISDNDAIATAAAALCGVHCGMPRSDTGKAVVLGGGDYSCFTALALAELGADVSLVTTRPMGLKDTPLNPLRDSKVEALGPDCGEYELGFSATLGDFDTVIDTLGDEANLHEVENIKEGLEKTQETGVAEKLRLKNNCDRYISTMTRSQKFVLTEGILFARNAVIEYQKEVEKSFHPSNFLRIPPPVDYGQETLQKLLDSGIIYPAESNENGPNAKKSAFVRGWSFPDYTELELWPRDSTGGSGSIVRFGFPDVSDLALEAAIKKRIAKPKPVQKKKNKQTNPFVIDISSLADITEEIVSKKRNCVLLVSASYCQLCRSLKPGYTRAARIAKEKHGDNLYFANANTGTKTGKQISFSLQVESVPTFILFKEGERYGTTFSVSKFPSEKLDLAVEYLLSEKEWDSKVFQDSEEQQRARTKVQ